MPRTVIDLWGMGGVSEWVKSLSHVQLFATSWTVACQAPLSMGFSREEYWNGLPFSSPWNSPNPGIDPRSPALKIDSLSCEPLKLLFSNYLLLAYRNTYKLFIKTIMAFLRSAAKAIDPRNTEDE